VPPLSAPLASVVSKNVKTEKFKNSLTKYISSIRALTEANRTNNRINGEMSNNLSKDIVNGVKNAAKSVYSVSNAALANPVVEPGAAEVTKEAAAANLAAANALRAQANANALRNQAAAVPSPSNVNRAAAAAEEAAAQQSKAAAVVNNANANIAELNKAMSAYGNLTNVNKYIANGRNPNKNNSLNKTRSEGPKYGNFFARVKSKITATGPVAQPRSVVSAVAPVPGNKKN